MVELPETPTIEPETPEAAVAIAAIEADKEITIAAIEAEARTASDEAYNETRQAEIAANRESETELCQRVATLEAEIAELRALAVTPVSLVSEEAMEEALAETLEAEAEAIAESLTALETDGTQASTVPTNEETPTEHGVGSEEEPLIPPAVEILTPEGKPNRVIRLI